MMKYVVTVHDPPMLVDKTNFGLVSIISLASRLNGYMYSNGKSLNVALFILMANHLAWCNLA